jgi:hypothetical protein
MSNMSNMSTLQSATERNNTSGEVNALCDSFIGQSDYDLMNTVLPNSQVGNEYNLSPQSLEPDWARYTHLSQGPAPQ